MGMSQLFALPVEWLPLFGLDRAYRPADSGLKGEEAIDLAVRGIPMGWHSAMGVAQAAHRGFMSKGTGGPVPAPAFPMDREMRKDKPVPKLTSEDPKLAEFSRFGLR